MLLLLLRRRRRLGVGDFGLCGNEIGYQYRTLFAQRHVGRAPVRMLFYHAQVGRVPGRVVLPSVIGGNPMRKPVFGPNPEHGDWR